MDDTTGTTAYRTTILDLPKEVLLDIFGYFVEKFPIHDPSDYYKPRASEASDRITFLGNNRLVCRAFDRLISPLLCPVVSVSLFPASIVRLEGLFRNPLIAQGVRGIAISLRFRPRAIATDFRRFHAHANSVLDDCTRECDWNTEFQNYDQDDISDDAVTYRAYHDAWSKICQMQGAWDNLFETISPQEEALATADGLENDNSTDEEEKAAQSLLKSCFEKYAASHAEQARIVSDGSFVRSITMALSLCGSLPFVWFNENQLGKDWSAGGAITLATTKEALARTLVQGHEWLAIEDRLCNDDDDTGLFFPARILTDLPIACHDAGIQLKGISIDCFPLLRGYSSLLPSSNQADYSVTRTPWVRFAAACNGLEIFNFGRRGMSCSPIRPERQNTYDLAIINGFIGAAISGPYLQRLYVNMNPFRVRSGRAGEKEKEHPYLASPIVAAITSTQLRSIVLHNVDICEQELMVLIKSASPVHLTDLYLASITLSHGRYAEAMGLLHDIVLLRRNNNSSKPNVTFSTLQGAEFGVPSIFDDDGNSWMWGSKEERDAFWDRLEEHQHPDLLKQVEQWIKEGQGDEANPLLKFEVA
ncbi:hypothetical protein P171DRAFT_428954 [Karstenula rhodostoma CBS 690.94]|uniref:Uncharacterized protein n=1 Tax=Karstenula rhodostoma CBS 690.94 TaxID=1392251 RepID=A0A9P4UEK0_9PLEO|nr:hypothetical protein P171DRAFT_428954 [Karstenula rhodostoma CBS 690.94]